MSCSSFAKPFYRDRATTVKMAADLQSQTRTWHLHVFANTVLMLVVSLWQVIMCKNEEGSSNAASNCCCSNECCHNQSDPCSLILPWVNLVMLQLTSCLQKDYWLYLYFSLCGLWDYLLLCCKKEYQWYVAILASSPGPSPPSRGAWGRG